MHVKIFFVARGGVVAERSPGSRLVRQRLGSGLRKLRETANIRIDAAARELECSTAKISRLENGLGPAKLWDVRILLDLYGVRDAATRKSFEQWARDSKSVSWWEHDSDLTTDDVSRYFAAETAAAQVRIFCTPVLPSQLQIPDYARAHIAAMHPDWPVADISRFVGLRIARQQALLREDDPLRIDAIVDEAAVRRRVGTSAVHAAQLSWLATTLDEFETAGRSALTLRILPFSAGPTRAIGSFTIFDPRRPDLDPTTACCEDSFGESWFEADDLDFFNEIFAEAADLALDLRSSRELIGDILRSLT